MERFRKTSNTEKDKERQKEQTKSLRIDEIQWMNEIQLDSSDARKRKNH